MQTIITHDAIVLGGGPAGISCALELHENRADYILIDRNSSLGGQLPDITNSIRNFAARYWDSGAAVRDDLEALCQKVGLCVQSAETIERIDLSTKTLYGLHQTYRAKAIFLATGTRRRTLPIERIQEFSDNVIWNVEAHQEKIKGKSIAVIGGGDNALIESLWLAQRCPSVLVVNRSDRFRARPDVVRDVRNDQRITVLEHTEVVSIEGESGNMQSILVRDNRTDKTTAYPVQMLVERVGTVANTEAFCGQVELDDAGFVAVDRFCKTNLDGVFAGGDLISSDCQGIARSVGDGMIAARSILKYLIAA